MISSRTTPAFLQQFLTPDPRFSPVSMWWWSGEKLEIGRLRWQLDQLCAMGIHNVVIINLAPSGTLFGSDADDPPFLSEPWWEIFAQVCDHARSIGTFIWFYDQIGFSGASYQAEIAEQHPEFLAEQLRIVSAEGVGDLSVECPLTANPIAAYAVALDTKDDTPRPISYLSLQGRRATLSAAKPARLSLVYSVRQGYDLFSASACQKLLDTVHRQFERRLPLHLGTTIVGSFQDELPDLPTWSRNFTESYSNRHGYSLEKVIHRLFEPGDADSRRTRLHYHAHRANLAEESFFKPFFQWHEDHQLLCGFDQQSPAREARVTASVTKYADYIQTHRWFGIPGSDHFGNGKLHASMAFMYDRPRVWLEGFHSTGWGGTIADTFDWLLPFFRSGVNLYNPHAVYYANNRGWWEWAAPSTCWRQPYARHYKPFADMIARLCKLLSTGVQQASIGVLFPTTTVQSAAGPISCFPDAQAADETFHNLIGSMRWHQQKLGWLDELSLDFHILDESTLQTAAIEGGAFVHREVPMHTIILPRVTMLHDATVDRLISFSESGGRVISIGASEIETPSGRIVRISDLPHASVVNSQEGFTASLRDVPTFIRCSVPTHYRRDGNLHILFIPAVAGMATQVDWPDWFSPMQHTTIVPERYLPSADLRLSSGVSNLVRFDPYEAKWKAVAFEQGKDSAQVKLDFEGAPFAVLVWSDSPERIGDIQQSTDLDVHSTLGLSDKWICEYVPTLPEDYAELRWPHTTDFQWTRLDLQDQVRETVRATFGIRAWRIDEPDESVKPLVWSPQSGILQDKLHLLTLGPKGHVPEEFIDLGKCSAGQRVTIRAGVISDVNREAILAIGANAHKAVKINGCLIESPSPEYLWTTPVHLHLGENFFDLILTAQREGSVRLFWCFLDPKNQNSFRRPERIIAPDKVAVGSSLSFERTFHVPQPLGEGHLKISTAAIATVYLDDKPLGRQGGFDPYRLQMRGQVYPTPPLPLGEHRIRVEVIQPERPEPLVVDFRAASDSTAPYSLMSDSTWTVRSKSSAPRPVHIHSKQDADSAAWHLYRRRHPLPQAESPQLQKAPSPVMPLPLIPPSATPIPQLFEWIIPPGAISMQLHLVETQASLQIDGTPTEIRGDGFVSLPLVHESPSRKAMLQINSRHLSGGVFTAPITYQFAPGTIRPGSWLAQGLRSYSGAIRMRQNFSIPATNGDETIILNLGQVRGTVEATLNGSVVGMRCLSPYQFDLTTHARSGNNELGLLVTNTLANLLSTCGPTRCWSPDQLESGLFGPAAIHIYRRRETIR